VLRRAFPLDLLEVEVEVRRRRGVDLQPVDVTTDEGVRLLWSFTVDPDRRARIERAAAAARENPPELVRGDYVELLPELLADRDPDNLTVVFQTISTIYLPVEQRSRVATAIDRAAEGGPLAWISTPTPEEHRLSGVQYPLELGIWPEGRRRLVGEMDNGGTWLDWWA